MLDYQVKYWQLQEAKRANRAQEELTRQQNLIKQESNRIQQTANEIAKYQAESNAYLGYLNAQSNAVQAKASWQNAMTNVEKQNTYNYDVETNAALKAAQVSKTLAEASNIVSTTKLNSARTELTKEQTKTEGLKQSNVKADTKYTKRKTFTETLNSWWGNINSTYGHTARLIGELLG